MIKKGDRVTVEAMEYISVLEGRLASLMERDSSGPYSDAARIMLETQIEQLKAGRDIESVRKGG